VLNDGVPRDPSQGHDQSHTVPKGAKTACM